MELVDSIITTISYIKQPAKRVLIREAAKFKGQNGIEIGGPTKFFGLKGGCPIYLNANKVDNVNYDSKSFFGDYEAGETFNYHRNKVGHQFIAEATELSSIPNSRYDFVLSSHSLEHTANPLKALKEWNRIIKPGGTLVLLLPDKRYTMDHKREYTSYSHLLEDFKNNMDEEDTTHFEEIMDKFDDQKESVGKNKYFELLKNNIANRCAHHHVFSQEVIRQALAFMGFSVNMQTEAAPFHLITIATKKIA
jgi:predicted SAM-dependent methyltransferase